MGFMPTLRNITLVIIITQSIILYLREKLLCIHQFTGAVGDFLCTLLSPAVVLEVLILNVIPTTHHEHIGLSEVYMFVSLIACSITQGTNLLKWCSTSRD